MGRAQEDICSLLLWVSSIERVRSCAPAHLPVSHRRAVFGSVRCFRSLFLFSCYRSVRMAFLPTLIPGSRRCDRYSKCPSVASLRMGVEPYKTQFEANVAQLPPVNGKERWQLSKETSRNRRRQTKSREREQKHGFLQRGGLNDRTWTNTCTQLHTEIKQVLDKSSYMR